MQMCTQLLSNYMRMRIKNACVLITTHHSPNVPFCGG